MMHNLDKTTAQESKLHLNDLGTLSEEQVTSGKISGLGSRQLEDLSADQKIAVIVRVSCQGYRPQDISPTTEVSPTIFTARLLPKQIRQLIDDPSVSKIEISQTLYSLPD